MMGRVGAARRWYSWKRDEWRWTRLEQRYGPALVKASCDHSDYAMGLTSGEVLTFNDCYLHGSWVTLQTEDGWGAPAERNGGARTPRDVLAGFPCPRGVNIPLRNIAWVADAPDGS
jgi:hypothetical protein